MLQSLVSLCTCFFLLSTTAQPPPAVEWYRSLGGSAMDIGRTACPLDDGRFLVAGGVSSMDGDATGNHGLNDALLVWLSESGTTLDTKVYGGTEADGAISAISCTTGGTMVIGTTSSTDGDAEGPLHGFNATWLLRLDDDGEIQWQRKYGGPKVAWGKAIAEMPDGGFLFGAYISGIDTSGNPVEGGDIEPGMGPGGYWLVRLDADGEILWQNRFGGSSIDELLDLELTSDGGCILAGYTMSDDGDVDGFHGGFGDGWLVKADHTGELEWARAMGGSSMDWFEGVTQASDGKYIVVGFTESNDGDISGHHGSSDGWVVKFDEVGTVIWQRVIGGSGVDQFRSVVATSDGGCVAAGTTNSTDGDIPYLIGGGGALEGDGWVARLDSSGTITWQLIVGGNDVDQVYSIEPTPDGGYFLIGYSKSTDGHGTGNHGEEDIWVVKLGPDVVGVEEVDGPRTVLVLFPNPAHGPVRIHLPSAPANAVLYLHDASGRVVHQVAWPAGTTDHGLDTDGLAPGTYIIRVVDAAAPGTQGAPAQLHAARLVLLE